MLPRFFRPAVGATLATSLLSSSLSVALPGQTPAPAPAPAAAAPANPTASPAPAATPTPTPPPALPTPTIVPTDLFAVPEGLEVTVWATTPQLHNPTNIDFDKDGRLWVAEGVNYRSHSGRQKEGDRIVILEDSDGDGKADKSDTFLQETGFLAPLGVAVLDNQLIVSQPPDLLVYTDVNRDGKFDPAVDKRDILLTGFNGRSHDHSLHSVTAGPDGQWYFNQGNTGALFKDKSGKTFRMGSPYVHQNGKQVVDPSTIAGQKSDDGHVWIGGFLARMNPDGSNVNVIAHNFRNSYEQAVNSFGDIYQSDNDDPPACRVTPVLEFGNAGFASADGQRAWAADRRPGQKIPTAEWRQEDPGTMPAGDVYGGGSPTGVAYYENGALGDKWQGLLLACEAGRNVIFGYLPKPDGAGFKLERFDFLTSNKEGKFAGSDFLGGTNSVTSELNTLFRPSDVTVGPDGALYVADWFDARVGGHADLDNTTSGTIYRIAPKGFKSVVPKFDLNTTEGQIAALKSPAPNVRYAGFTRLKAQGGKAAPAVAALLQEKNPYLAARAIWLLAQMGPAGVAKVEPLLTAKEEQTRVIAYRALRRANHNVVTMATKMASDASPAVRREVALSLRDVPFAQSGPILVEVAKRFDGKDRTYLEALGLGAEGNTRALYAAIKEALPDGKADPEAWSDAFARLTWRLSPPDAVPALKARILSSKLSREQRKLALDSLAFIKSPFAALAMVEIAEVKDSPLKGDTLWWLFNRRAGLWKDYGLTDALKERGIYDADADVALTPFVSPELPTTPSTLPPVEDILKLQGDAARGKIAVATCYTCHKIGEPGVDFGPDLTVFGKTQTREVLLNAIINPSGDIAHGYEGKRIVTKDGVTIDGMVLSNDDPVQIKSMGGVIQAVPKRLIKSNTGMKHSLMFTADMMALNAQALADIVAYLKSDDIK
ncbi:PVC-type heme-binding CxxCH protein [Verrucomicrobium sp. BvORR106]|uniref:PVC-type heme-binding CxxCH protein n=1 Tax=Verrucomicrobium sp. BvORR106 TaxID=1403819 RepID=UPI00056F2B06|nr:PVC-type heme-binding CxxCH protein [Verrucomicrobium sp. BvORR106]